ncbi:patatin-like phospholipase family protein [Shewanella salipaludis]|uniref:Patatin n=1 Tax=Shewanella salipaludis TaxID=2723052 RepID=A0A972JMX1_9GAMM|nr:patatin-like phospholipase family protein [Shewanella salipaludis]NMH66952.1 patatin [Shewanella salipaludis]
MLPRSLVLLLLALVTANLAAAERPKIGLVLSGGGAKGAAHLGVLRVLEEHHIPVDYIAGTSIGAYVAGMYALGYSAAEVEVIMMHADWSSGYSDTIPRQELSYRDKVQRDQYNIPLNLGYRDGAVQTPSGLLRGQTMSQLLRDSTDLVEQFGDFDQLAIPYRAVATDLETSLAVVLGNGSLVQAMQASATVPGALQPALIDDKLLVDGGIANNMPVDVVKAMGADIIIAVDIGSPLVEKDKLNGTLAVLDQLSTILTNASTERQKALLTEDDILIRPSIDGLSTTDFSLMPQALALGREATEAQLPKLQALSIGAVEYAQYTQDKIHRSRVWRDEVARPLVQIAFDNQSKVSESLLRETLGLHEGEVVGKAQLNEAINRIYSLNKFERIDAEFKDTAAGRVLTLTTKAKSWGPNYFQLGFNWEDDFTLDSSVSLDTAFVMTDLTDNGGEWRNELKLGFEKMLGTEFYQPLDRDQQFYSRSRYQYELKNWVLYDANTRVFTLDKSTHRLDLGLGYNYVEEGIVELGVTGEVGTISNDAILEDDFELKSWGGYLKFGYDSLDSISFPTRGNLVNVTLYYRQERYSEGEFDYEPGDSYQVVADWKGVVSVGSHSFVGKASYTRMLTDSDFTVNFAELGGFLNLSGYHKNSLAGPDKVFGAFIYQYDLGRDVLGMTEFPLYLGASLEGGNVWQLDEKVDLSELIYSGSLFLGTDTALGPAALGFGVSDEGENAVYLFLGKNF